MNLADIGNEDETATQLSGIIGPGDSINCEQEVRYCLNLGKLKGGVNLHLITSNSRSIRTENYYDSTKNMHVNDSIVRSVYGKESEELKSGEPLDSDAQYEWTTTNNWSFEKDRYPLPNIGEDIPGGEKGVYWQAVLTAAEN